jgi:large subunit ribosomal protein L5
MTPRLKELYSKEIVAKLVKEFNYSNSMQAPRLKKIVLNMGLGEGSKEAKIIEAATRDMTAISGQRPVVTRAKKSIASFKLRAGMSVGCMVTLRGVRMYEFLDRLINFSMPRIRDFRGVSDRSFDGRGNYTIGIKEQIIFPEIDYDKIDKIRGMNITISTSANTDEEAKALLKHLGMAFAQ